MTDNSNSGIHVASTNTMMRRRSSSKCSPLSRMLRQSWNKGPPRTSEKSTPVGPRCAGPSADGSASVISLHMQNLFVQLGDFGALNAETSHQTLLVEDERVDVVLQGRGGQRPCLAFVDDDNGRPDPDFPTIARVQILNRLVVHQEQRVAELLHAGLQAKGPRHGVIAPDDPAAPHHHALTVSPADHKTSP